MLELNAPPLGWSRDTTAEALDVGEEDELKTLPKGSPMHGLGIQVMDALGRLLEEVDSFKKAAVIIADICSLQVGMHIGIVRRVLGRLQVYRRQPNVDAA
jgi:hypothetical protein